MALMEAFGIRVELGTDSSYEEIEGFVLADGAIAANWLRDEDLWRVDAHPSPGRQSTYREIDSRLCAESAIDGPSSVWRLEAAADYLGVSWSWLRRRCEELAVAGVDGITQPRSRRLSTKGLDTATRFIAHIDTIEGSDLACC